MVDAFFARSYLETIIFSKTYKVYAENKNIVSEREVKNGENARKGTENFSPFFLLQKAVCLFVSFLVVCLSEQVVDTRAVKIRELYKNGGRDIVFSRFIFRIAGLAHSEIFCHLRLSKIPVFPQISYSSVHIFPSLCRNYRAEISAPDLFFVITCNFIINYLAFSIDI